jgi:hypothetical protein
MSKKSDKGNGVSFSPELGEVIRRLKRKEPELDEMVDQEGAKDDEEEGTGSKDD